MRSSIAVENGTLVYRTPYNPGLVAAIKAAVPASDRKWDAVRKVWLVAPAHGPALAAIAEQYLGVVLAVPSGAVTAARPETRVLDVRYIGATKDRGDGSRTAFGWVDGAWGVIFPEEALKTWFNVETRPDEEPTLYGVLALKQNATPLEIRQAYRRLARQWHPDVSREPGSKEQFIHIKHAYDVLGDPNMRARYNAGLALTATMSVGQGNRSLYAPNGYRSPLRCGLIMATGVETLGRFVVSEVHAWEDVVNAAGQILVTSWIMGADAPEEGWV